MQSAYIEHPPQRYRLNMQVLADELEAHRVGIRFYCRGEEASLTGVRFYNRGENLRRDYVYLLIQEDRRQDFRACENIHFVVMGEVSLEEFSFTSSMSLSRSYSPPSQLGTRRITGGSIFASTRPR